MITNLGLGLSRRLNDHASGGFRHMPDIEESQTWVRQEPLSTRMTSGLSGFRALFIFRLEESYARGLSRLYASC
jgi:hypothetical protein